MADDNFISNQRDTLHKRAERLLRRNPRRISGISKGTVPELVHDLAVRQIELELQARDLRRAQAGIEELRTEYMDFYDCAPVGYLTFDPEGVILNANLTAERLLGIERELLIHKPFSSFVHTDSQDAISLHFRRVVYSKGRVTCTLIVKRGDGTYFDATIDSIATRSGRRRVVFSTLIDMARQKMTEAQLRESEERYRVAIENSNDGVVLVRGNCHIYVNQRFLDIFGYSRPEEVVGKTHHLTVHPDDQERVIGYNSARQRGEAVPDSYEFKGIKKDGTPIYVEASSAGITYRGEPASLAYLRDITKRKNAERALQESKEKFRLLFEKSADPILLLDGDTYVDCNEAALRLVGCSSKDQLIGLHPWDISPERQPDGRLSSEKVKDLNGVTMRQGTNQFEWICRTFGGEEFWVEVSHTVIPIQGRQIIYSVWRDIREGKQAEKRQKLANNILETLNGPGETLGVIRRILFLLKEHTAVDAIGIRLRREAGFPFVEAIGFPEHFLEAERSLFARDEGGGIIKDESGGPCLECLCGRVIRGRTDPSLPFFTKLGSFCTNSATGLLTSLKDDPRERIRDCCLSEGYETMVLVPLRSRVDIIGLLQLNDRRPDRSNQGTIEFIEGIAASIGMALARKEAEERLHASEHKYRNIFENAIEGIYQSTPQGRLLSVNPSLARMHGYESPEEMIRAVVDTAKEIYVNPEDRQRYRRLLDEYGVVRNFEAEKYRKDRTTFWGSMNTRAVKDHEGKTLYYEGIIEDITERKRLEGQLRQTQKMEAIGTLSAGIAHDFNSILTAILGFADLGFEDAPAASKVKRHLARILRAAQRGKDLVKQILSFSRKSEEELRPTALASVVRESIRMLRASLPKTIEMRLDITTEPSMALADPTQVQQIIMNLGTNAAHAMWERGGLMTVDLSCVTVTSGDAPDPGLTPGPYLRLSVSDTGRGMERDVLERVFDPFFTTKKRGEGTGLGLWVVQAIVKNHKGAITVRSTPGAGSTIEVFFPRISEPILPESEPLLSALKGQGHLLIVDDEAELVEMEKEMVERLGYSATAVSESLAALALFKEDPGKYDLVLTDQTMPNMAGLDLARELISIRPDIPIVLITGYRDVVDTESVGEAGVKKVIAKPMTRAEIGKAIKQLLPRDGR
ncbi:MAG: PAS domain S-box protein [Syntrophorhabdales bacterium]|jgi:PAS domain S-box-containing protein